MTTQSPDRIIWRHRKYFIAGIRGERLLNPIDFGITPTWISTACYRGYKCEYKFVNDKLFLSEMAVRSADDQYPVINGKSPRILCNIGEYHNLRLFCMFSGGLVLVRNELSCRYVRCNPSSFRTVIEIVLAKGQIEEVINHSVAMRKIRRRIEKVKVKDFEDQFRIEREIEWSFASGYREQPEIFADANP